MASEAINRVTEVYSTYNGPPWSECASDDPLWDERWPYSSLFRQWRLHPAEVEEVEAGVLVFLEAERREKSKAAEESRPVAHVWDIRDVASRSPDGGLDLGGVRIFRTREEATASARRAQPPPPPASERVEFAATATPEARSVRRA